MQQVQHSSMRSMRQAVLASSARYLSTTSCCCSVASTSSAASPGEGGGQQQQKPQEDSTSGRSTTFQTNRRNFDSLARRHSPSARTFNVTASPGLGFTIRPAPSPLPPTIAASPPNVTTHSVQHLPPRLHPVPALASADSTVPDKRRMTPEEVAEMQALRLSDPETWTRNRLARKYNVSPFFVAISGFGDSPEARKAGKSVQEAHAEQDWERRQSWGFKKRVDREVRLRRRELW